MGNPSDVTSSSTLSEVQKSAEASYDRMAKSHENDMSSKATPFRNFNNFIKKKLIQGALDRVAVGGPKEVAVLDLASGRGGDLMKWGFMQSPPLSGATRHLPTSQLTRCTHYDCFDISPQSIAGAEARFAANKDTLRPTFQCSFQVANVFEEPFLTEMESLERYGQYDVVSIQFALHYACVSREQLGKVLTKCHGALRVGGVLIATIVDADELEKRLPIDQNEVIGQHFRISVRTSSGNDNKDAAANSQILTRTLKFGQQYHFLLEDFVDCDEYLITKDVLGAMTRDAGFVQPDQGEPFGQSVALFQSGKKGVQLAPEDVELVTLYRTVVLVKE